MAGSRETGSFNLGLFNNRLLFTVSTLALSQFNFGFEGMAFNSIQAMDDFIDMVGTKQPDGKIVIPSDWLSLFNGFSIVGFAAGLIVGNRITEKFGRLWTIRIMSIWTIICTTILITCRNRDQMMAGRALNYLYIGMELAVIPLYQAEITPLQNRGAMVASYNTALNLGSLIMSLVCYGTSTIPGKTSYILPIGLFYIIPTIVLISSIFMPESPRWLALQGRYDEGLAALRQIRERKFSDDEIEEEFAIIRSVSESYTDNSTEKQGFFKRWLKIWSAKNIKRTGIVLATNFFLHGTGNAFASMYGTIFYKSIGTINPFALSTIASCLVVFISLATLILVDIIGRRPILLCGSFLQATALLIMGGLGMITAKTLSVSSGIIAMMMIFQMSYCAAWGQLSHTITAELPSAEVRDLTYVTGSLLAISTQTAMTFGLPYLLNAPYAALGPRVGFIFGSLAALSFVFAFFCVPECKGKSLEEIDHLFNTKVPVLQFHKVKPDIAAVSEISKCAVEDAKSMTVHQEKV
ncbi:unnamed protein product [Clonostachys rosea]|uniref:Major facilitator superfamily (MFS) profile domain-containing protein n=1 Tax=Bionectria ochroleuca TaxID=29856 RepID=A0ABY6UUH9_BIOOC|nr:unnamed protein product [Clonostachys rosea]